MNERPSPYGFSDRIETREIDGERWQILNQVRYRSYQGITFSLEVGAETDFASSICKIPTLIFGNMEVDLLRRKISRREWAAFHDQFYRTGCASILTEPVLTPPTVLRVPISRKTADTLAHEMLGHIGATDGERWRVYWSLRLFGGCNYHASPLACSIAPL